MVERTGGGGGKQRVHLGAAWKGRGSEAYLAEVERQAFSSGSYELAVLSPRVRLALLQDDFTSANEFLESHRELARHAAPWSSLSSAETETRALIRQARWQEGLAKAEKGLEELGLESKNVKPFVVTFMLQRAIALSSRGTQVPA